MHTLLCMTAHSERHKIKERSPHSTFTLNHTLKYTMCCIKTHTQYTIKIHFQTAVIVVRLELQSTRRLSSADGCDSVQGLVVLLYNRKTAQWSSALAAADLLGAIHCALVNKTLHFLKGCGTASFFVRFSKIRCYRRE